MGTLVVNGLNFTYTIGLIYESMNLWLLKQSESSLDSSSIAMIETVVDLDFCQNYGLVSCSSNRTLLLLRN